MLEREKKLSSQSLKISCVIPVNNEEDCITQFILSLSEKLSEITNHKEIIIVDDGSKDNTTGIVSELCLAHSDLKLLKLSRNFGKETALTAGLEHVTGDVVVLIDADFQHPIGIIDDFLQFWSQGYNMIYGVQQNRPFETKLKRSLTNAFYKLMQIITQVNIVPHAGDFRLLDIQVVQSLNLCEERGRFMKGLYAWVGYKSIGIPFQAPPRTQGKSSWKLYKLAELAITGITTFSNAPLRVWSLMGLIIACISFLCAMYLISKTLLFGVDLPGYASLMVAIIFFGGVQLFSIGVLGEYIARIFNEVKRRPKYIVEKKLGF
jgi:polyisoprenyl-phosphate glycosyltransferase